MKSNKYCKAENIIFFLLVLFGLFICVLFICDLIQDSKRIENPSIELIEKVEKKYLNGNLVDDFKVDDSIFNKPTAEADGILLTLSVRLMRCALKVSIGSLMKKASHHSNWTD